VPLFQTPEQLATERICVAAVEECRVIVVVTWREYGAWNRSAAGPVAESLYQDRRSNRRMMNRKLANDLEQNLGLRFCNCASGDFEEVQQQGRVI
jgi:hypothetical protein